MAGRGFICLWLISLKLLLVNGLEHYICESEESHIIGDPYLKKISKPNSSIGKSNIFNVELVFTRGTGGHEDCHMYMTVHGEEGTTTKRSIPKLEQHQDGQDETWVSMQYNGLDIGVPKRIQVELSACPWLPLRATVTSALVGHRLEIDCRSSIPHAPSHKLLSRIRRNAYRSMKVLIHTADVKYAGTDSAMYLYIIGKTKSWNRLRLSGSYEQGDWDTTWLSVGDIGIVTSIRIGHDNTGEYADWLLDTVDITESGEGTYSFRCGCWLEGNTLWANVNVNYECSPITACVSQRCVTCDKCEGIVSDAPGWRAYRLASDRRSCTKLCSWRRDSKFCYPGHCADELMDRCECSPGFSGHNCQTMEDPSILYNHLLASGSGIETAEAPLDVNDVTDPETSWTNIKAFTNLTYDFKTKYIPEGIAPERPAFIEDYSVGIIKGEVIYTFTRDESEMTNNTRSYACDGVSETQPGRTIVKCSAVLESNELVPSSLQTGDIMDFKFSTTNGGFVKIRDLENDQMRTEKYLGKTKTVSVRLGFDYINPYHCMESEQCSLNMLTVPRSSLQPVIKAEWDGWKDDMAGIGKYVISAFEMEYIAGEGGVRNKKQSASGEFNNTLQMGEIQLPCAGLYAIEISAYDKAGNYRSSRRIMVYESDSKVETTHLSVLRVMSAAVTSSWDWQWTSDSVTIDWESRYINKVHLTNNWLKKAIAVPNVDDLYDDHGYSRGVDEVPHVQAIVEFRSAFLIDHDGGDTILVTPDDDNFTTRGINQSETIFPPLVDGDTLRYWVRAYDVRDEYLEENVTVHIDTSPPIIENLWLTRGDRLNISIHRIEELNTMTIEWESYDDHSGLETVSWRVFDNYTGEVVVHGIEHLTAQGDTEDEESCNRKYGSFPRGSNCYCTPGVGCYHRHYQVKPKVIDDDVEHGGIHQKKNRVVHDNDFFLEVTVMNHAKLTTVLQSQITIDSSPPHTGAVHDGQRGDPEVDYQERLQFHAHWEGFFDKESGVKFYQYGFSNSCLQKDDFGLNISAVEINETYSTHASWIAPSPGKFYITVVAYNRALESSPPVCSDGVTVDKTEPVLSQIAVKYSRTSRGLVTVTNGDVWLITKDRRRSKIHKPDDTCRAKATNISDDDLQLIPRLRNYKGIYVSHLSTACSHHDGFSLESVNVFYIFKEHTFYVNWTCSDEESGIHDYQLGLMSDPSDVGAPGILPYTSTHHHPHYQGFHPALSEGQQFYIAVKAINRAGLVKTEIVGPIIVHTQPAVFQPPVTVTLQDNYLIAKWIDATFTDPVKEFIQYEFAIGSSPSGSEVLPFHSIQTGGNCSASTPPSCTAVDISDLHWDLHHSHTYYISIKVTNIVGLWTIAVSEPYKHDVRLPSPGVVLDVSPEKERELFDTTEFDDADFQLSTSTLDARWYGFDDGLTGVTYKVCIGSSPGKDDVRALEDAGSDLFHRFENLELAVNKMYYVTVTAKNGAGEIIHSSDGVRLIRHNADIKGVTVFDGPTCNKTSQTKVCFDDVNYQISSSLYTAHWTRGDQEVQLYGHAYVSLEKKLPTSDNMWKTSRDYEHVGDNHYAVFGHLFLDAGHTYRAAVKFCEVKVCSNPVYSDGVIVLPHLPVPGVITVKYTEAETESTIKVTMDRFRDPDIPVESESYEAIDRYEWGLTDNSHNANMLIHWTPVSNMITEDTKESFEAILPKHLIFNKCRRIAVRVFNKAGAFTTVSADIRNCKSINPALVVPSIVIDAVGRRRGNGIGSSINLRKNAKWGAPDVDYTPYKNILSAVWPSLRHLRYKWAVIAGDTVDSKSYLKSKSLLTVSDPCKMPNAIKCGYSVREYVNVKFDDSELLKHGQRFHICVHTIQINAFFEKWRTALPEVNECSDGITVDLTPPSKGTITVKNLHEGIYQWSHTEVSLSWDGFTDVEESGVISHHSGISHYQVALGSMPGGEDVRPFLNVGLVNNFTFTGLSLQNGHTLYSTVKASDFVNHITLSTSEGFIVDNTPPKKSGKMIQFENRYVTSSIVPLCWKGVLVDSESGISYFKVSIGTSSGESDVITSLKTQQYCYNFDLSAKSLNGNPLYITLKAFNDAGLYTIITSHALTMDTTPPSVGHVFDGKVSDALDDEKDKDHVTSIDDMGAHWDGFSDPHSTINHFKVKVGTFPGWEDTVPEFEAGARSDAVFKDHFFVFAEGIKYYVTVTACNKANLCSYAISDGVVLDQSPPVPGQVFDGSRDRDIQYQASRTYLGCKWNGFQDPESGLDYYEWRIGTTPGGRDILIEQHAALEEVAYKTLSNSNELPVGEKLFCTVRAYNKGGLFTESTSNGFVVDDTAPVVVKSPGIEGGQGSLVAMTLMSRTTMRISWEMKDEESFIEKQYISIASHQLGEFDSSLLQLPGLLREYTYTKLDLHDGSNYTVKITGCNMAGMCTSADTGEILFDSSIPTTGMLAVETDHAARLSRHQSYGMTWTGTSLNLAWLGFADLHSDIDHYLVSIGSKPFSVDLMPNGNSKQVKHNTSGVDKEDEGVVQVFSIDTKDVSSRSTVFVAIWAVNGVGLRSSPQHSELILGKGGQLDLVRRCSPYNCEGHCVCAVQDKKCAISDGCTADENGGNNAVITVADVIDLTSLNPTDEDIDFSPSDTFLAATWSITNDQGGKPVRYEYSVGKSEMNSPKGIFNGASERIWHDAAVNQFIVVPLIKGMELTPGLRYSVFVRAWYNDKTYSIFKSDGVLIDNSQPQTTDKTGKAVKKLRKIRESKHIDYQSSNNSIHISWDGKFLAGKSGLLKYRVQELKEIHESKDIDYQSSNNSIHISWDGKFLAGMSGLLKYRVYISTSPGGHSIHGSSDETKHNYTVNGINMVSGTVYFSSILVYNRAGLVGWTYSDGVQSDMVKPITGIIQDGDKMHDTDYQSSPTDISASWFGFSDTDSTIVKFFWCVGKTNDTNDCGLLDWQDVGLHTSATTQLDTPQAEGSELWTKVYAVDAVGHLSTVAVSDGLIIDISPPKIKDEAFLGKNMVSNPSFEDDKVSTGCNKPVPTSWETSADSCIKVVTPNALNAKHGKNHLTVSGSIHQNLTGLVKGRTYLLTVHTGYPETLTANHKAVEGSVSIGREVFTFSLDPRLCKGVCHVDEQSFILWSSHKYKFVADSQDAVLRIATATREMEIVFDHVTLQAIEYSKDSDTVITDAHLVVHSVFLPHWSSLHALWHFEDKESPIVDYTWAIGTVPGGTQIQKFVSVGRHSHGTLTGLRLTHNQKLYLTITARNAAGLTTVSHPDPITVDMTPPVFSLIIDGTDSDIDYLKVGDMHVKWQAEEVESQIQSCDWAIGRVPGSSDIKMFETVPTGGTSAKFDFTEVLNSTSLKVYSTVRCFNWVGLMGTATTDGVTVMRVDIPPKTLGIQFIEDKVSYQYRGSCHTSNSVHVHWSADDNQPTIIEVTDESSTYKAKVENHLEFVTFSGLHVKNRTTYYMDIYPDTIAGVTAGKVALNFTLHGKPPGIAENSTIKLTKNGNHLSVTWADVFASSWKHLQYVVCIGTVKGGTDIVERDLLTAPEIHLTLASDHNKLTSFHISVMAVDRCGYSNYISQLVEIK